MFKLSDHFWRRLNTIAGYFVVVAVFGLLVFVANLEIKDLDLWLHIGMGRYIVEHMSVPTVDVLSCSVMGHPWVNHEWLFQVIVYLIYNSFGTEGLITMQVWLVSLTLLMLVFLGYSRKNQVLGLFSLLLVSLVYHSRFTIRPDLYSLFFFAAFVLILAFFINRRWSIWALFILQVLWANMHGFFFLGPFLVLLNVLGEWFKRSAWLPAMWKNVGRLTDEEYLRMKILLAVVIGACFITPQGIDGAIYPLKVFTQISGESKVFFSKIIELQRPITSWNALFSMTDWSYYKILILLSFFSFILNWQKIDIAIFLFWLFFLFFSLAAIRNLVFFAFAAYLVIAINLASVRFKDVIPIRFTERKFLYITNIFAKALIVLWIMHYHSTIANNGYFDFDHYRRKSEYGGISLRQFPYKAVNFLVKNKVQGNFYNDFNSGAYLIGRCFPNIKVFIDGRTEVYGPKFFNYYRAFNEFEKVDEFKKALRRFQITGIFFNSNNSVIPPGILNYIYKSRDWVVVYFDYDGMIFLKDVPLNRAVISKNRINLTKWKPIELDLYRLGARDITQYQNVNRAFTLESIDLDEAAIAEANAALKVNPNYASPYKLLGKIAAKKKDFELAYHYFRTAVTLSFYDQMARLNMAMALADLKRYDQAVEQYHKIIEIWPDLAKAYFRLAKVEIIRKNYDLAYQRLAKAVNLEPANVENVVELGDLLLENKQFDLSRKAYELVLKNHPEQEKIYIKLCDLSIKAGQRVACTDILKQGIEKNPKSKLIQEKMRSSGVRVKAK